MKAQAIQYTIRGIPTELDKALREKAAREHSSLNQVVIEELSHAILGETKKADFMDLVGKWVEDEGFDEMMSDIRRVDPEDWK